MCEDLLFGLMSLSLNIDSISICLKYQKQQMFLRHESKRFQRSFVLQSPSSKQLQPATTTGSQHELIDSSSRRNLAKHNNCEPVEISNSSIWARLSQMEEMLEVERLERMSEHERIINMMKDMQCKHSSIIYNSQIRYFKSPPKPGIFYCHNLNEDRTGREETLKKVSSSTCLGSRNKENKEAKTVRLTPQEQDRNSVQAHNPESHERVEPHNDNIYLCQKDLTAKLQLLKSQLREEMTNWKQAMDTQIHSSELRNDKLQNEINSKMDEFQKNSITTYGQISHRLRGVEQKTNACSIFLSAETEKLQKVKKCVNELVCGLGQKLSSMCETLIRQTQDIAKLYNMNQLSHNIYSNKIHEIFQFIGHKLEDAKSKWESLEAQKLKQLQGQRLRALKEEEQIKGIRQSTLREIDNRIYSQEVHLKAYLTKQIAERNESTENSLITVIGRHISTVEAYLRKNEEKEDIIMKSYLARAQTNESAASRICCSLSN